MMKLFKKYVKVISLCDEDGNLTPGYIVWINGQKYKIDKVLENRQTASPAGGCGIRYRYLIDGRERNLFYETNRWFVETYRP